MIRFHEKGPAVVNDNIDELVIEPDMQDEFFNMCHENPTMYWTASGMWFELDKVSVENAIETADAEQRWPDFKAHRAKLVFSSMYCQQCEPPNWA